MTDDIVELVKAKNLIEDVVRGMISRCVRWGGMLAAPGTRIMTW